MDLASLTLAAVLSLAKPPAVDTAAERPRLEAIAAGIARSVEERDDLDAYLPGSVVPLPFQGPERRAATALALVAIAFHESAFKAEVQDCRRVGFKDPSITLWQLNGPFARGPYSREVLCTNVRRAAERGLFVLAHHGRRCGTPQGWFHGYAGGNCGRASAAGRRQCAIWERLAGRAGLLASCSTPTVSRR